jgi:hypothetical protein
MLRSTGAMKAFSSRAHCANLPFASRIGLTAPPNRTLAGKQYFQQLRPAWQRSADHQIDAAADLAQRVQAGGFHAFIQRCMQRNPILLRKVNSSTGQTTLPELTFTIDILFYQYQKSRRVIG